MRSPYSIIVGLCIAAFGMASLPVRAQEAPQPTVSVKFTVVGWTSETAYVAYKNNGKRVPFQVTPFTRSKVYSYTGPADMEVFMAPSPETDNDADSGAAETRSQPTKMEKVGVVTFPVGPKRFTVLLGLQNGRCGSRVIVDDDTDFPLGTARVFNLTPMRLLLRCNQKTTVNIPADKYEIVRPRPDFQLVTEAAFERQGQWVRSNDDFIYIPPDSKTSVFYFLNDSKYFKSIDGGSRDVQLVVLSEKPEKEDDKSVQPK